MAFYRCTELTLSSGMMRHPIVRVVRGKGGVLGDGTTVDLFLYIYSGQRIKIVDLYTLLNVFLLCSLDHCI